MSPKAAERLMSRFPSMTAFRREDSCPKLSGRAATSRSQRGSRVSRDHSCPNVGGRSAKPGAVEVQVRCRLPRRTKALGEGSLDPAHSGLGS